MAVEKIYFIGICGVAMGSLAMMFKESGFQVSGSDENVYPPMSDLLRSRGIGILHGYHESNISDPDLIIVGNAISRGNPEVEHMLNQGLPYMSMARAIYTYFLAEKEVIAVCGTHGKSTTAAILAHILTEAGHEPSFLIGATLTNYGSNFILGKGTYFVIEGDEYDSAYFEKVPKFIFYRPRHLLLTSLEFDHADIYSDLDEIELWFSRLINMVPSRGWVVYSAEYDNLKELVRNSLSMVRSFGDDSPDTRWRVKDHHEGRTELELDCLGDRFRLSSTLVGAFNYDNISAASAMARSLGVDISDIRKALETFQGIRRRQELIYKKGTIMVYEDFAHHPTAIKAILTAMRERFSHAILWALYEPRSATSRRKVFQNELPRGFLAADRILIKEPYRASSIAEDERLDMGKLKRDIEDLGGEADIYPGVKEMLDSIGERLDPARENIFVIMSNGAFDGIYEKIQVTIDKVLVPKDK